MEDLENAIISKLVAHQTFAAENSADMKALLVRKFRARQRSDRMSWFTRTRIVAVVLIISFSVFSIMYWIRKALVWTYRTGRGRLLGMTACASTAIIVVLIMSMLLWQRYVLRTSSWFVSLDNAMLFVGAGSDAAVRQRLVSSANPAYEAFLRDLAKQIGITSVALPAGTWSNSCTNAYYDGSVLTATCNPASAPTSISTPACQPGTIQNNNGTLVCLPTGNWNTACTNPRFDTGSTRMYATCDGRDSSIDTSTCENKVDVSVRVLQPSGIPPRRLICSKPTRTLPPGSWTGTCKDATFNGTALTATCLPSAVPSTIDDVTKCTDILNDKGVLKCSERLPKGQWTASCTAKDLKDAMFTATCGSTTSTLDLKSCAELTGVSVENTSVNAVDGRLVCELPLPDGTWKDSCKNATFDGKYLEATCDGGGIQPQVLNVNKCIDGTIWNDEGTLRCADNLPIFGMFL